MPAKYLSGSGLFIFKVHLLLDKFYETGKKVADDFKETMEIVFDDFLPAWNYKAIRSVK
ncbi:MAG: hypothetical protein GY737_01565 [Desulfobacteraceae bacterium]|nr:hypothetical protein [Desulfobacteraceae bacterium]